MLPAKTRDVFVWTLCINTAMLNTLSLYKFSTFADLKSSFACSNLVLLSTNWIERFCLLRSFYRFVRQVLPQVKLSWFRCECILEYYNAIKNSLSKNGFALCMSSTFLDIVFSRCIMCPFHDKLSYNKTPRNFIVLKFHLSISWLFNFNVGRWEGMLYFLPDFWKNDNLVFLTFSASLFTGNHSLILINSSLTVLNSVFMLLCSKKKLVLSANIIRTNKHIWRIREIVYIQQK